MCYIRWFIGVSGLTHLDDLIAVQRTRLVRVELLELLSGVLDHQRLPLLLLEEDQKLLEGQSLVVVRVDATQHLNPDLLVG